MIVMCESCKTKFRLDPARLKKPGSKVRCSRCGHIFGVNPPDDDEEMLIHVDLSEDVEPKSHEEILSSRPFIPPRAGAKPRKKPSLGRWILLALPLVLLLGGLLWLANAKFFSSSDSTKSEKAVSTELAQPEVAIKEDATKAYFLENVHAGQVFVVEGEVVNESSKPISFILLEGKLYTTNNQVAQSQRCFSGNILTRNELTQLNVTEIQNRMMNREGKNLMNVHIPPQNRVPFMLVFHNLPELNALTDYSVEVISSKID